MPAVLLRQVVSAPRYTLDGWFVVPDGMLSPYHQDLISHECVSSFVVMLSQVVGALWQTAKGWFMVLVGMLTAQ